MKLEIDEQERKAELGGSWPAAQVPEEWVNAIKAAREYIASGQITVYVAQKLIEAFDSLLAAPSIAEPFGYVSNNGIRNLRTGEHSGNCAVADVPSEHFPIPVYLDAPSIAEKDNSGQGGAHE